MEEPVILIVKAPNQQIDDQTIHCDGKWSVKRLKSHLSEVYPSKPRLEDQKLIYSGQLLNDNIILKDVLRKYEGQENHTVHLVCSPLKESMKIPLKKFASVPQQNPAATPDQTAGGSRAGAGGLDGLRHRVNAPAAPTWPLSFTASPTGQTPQPMSPMWPPTYDAASMAQQMAWMQQAYAQYMTQYMQLMASGGNMPMGMPTMNPVPPAGHPPPLRDDPVPVNEPVPNAEDEEVQVNRDWLDWFYITSRALVLFSIVYFYSSPVRFFVVSTLGIIMYLYQVGFFRAVQRLDQQEEVPETPPPTPDNNNTPEQPEAPEPRPPAPPTALAVTWAAFSGFFLSLIPEQPNVL